MGPGEEYFVTAASTQNVTLAQSLRSQRGGKITLTVVKLDLWCNRDRYRIWFRSVPDRSQ